VAERPQRLFVAVPLPPDARAAVTSIVDEVRRDPVGRVPRWVHLPNLHVTLRFLGDTDPGRVPAVVDAVRRALAGQPAFDVVLAGAGGFPRDGRPRTIWLGIEQGAGRLGELAAALDPALVSLGWPGEPRPFRPHLTLARVDAARGTEANRVVEALRTVIGDRSIGFRAERVVLYRSHLGGGAPRHEPILELALDA
jgi:2'-5' RNA ligase